MDSVFCFEVAVDCLALRKRVKCHLPYIAVAFLDFPTILLHMEPPEKHSRNNLYNFTKGKSCLFKMSPTEMYEKLTKTPIYVVVLDKGVTEQKCIGSSSIEMKQTVKRIVSDLQTNGLHQVSCHGETLALPIINFAHANVGCLKMAYKLTSLGHSMLSHLSSVLTGSNIPSPESNINIKSVDAISALTSIENVITPPPLFYTASNEINTEAESKDAKSNSHNKGGTNTTTAVPAQTPSHLPLEQDSNALPKRSIKDSKPQGKFISIQVDADKRTEATQTESKSLSQYPILSALVKEVLQLSIARDGSFNLENTLENIESKKVIQKESSKVVKSPARLTQTKSIGVAKSTSKPTQKHYPLQYGLTKSLRLRMALVAEQEQTITATKAPRTPYSRMEKKRPKSVYGKTKKKSSPKGKRGTAIIDRELTPEPEIAEVFDDDPSFLSNADSSSREDGKSKHVGLGLEDLVIVRDISSPRAQSRQSIEIRLPSVPKDEQATSGNYNYSDDFDDEKSWSYERTTSVLTTFEISPQPTVLDPVSEAENTTHEVSNLLTVDVSPQHTISDVSPSAAFATPRETTMEDLHESITSPQFATFKIQDGKSKNLKYDNDSSQSSGHNSPHQESKSVIEEDSKPTDDSASHATTLFMNNLPVPAPSSDSPVIRSLASEPRIRPHPPSRSHSLSHEKLHRKYRMSTESSFQISEPSDIRTSELGDIKTSDIMSELNTSTENATPNLSGVLERKISFPKLDMSMSSFK